MHFNDREEEISQKQVYTWNGTEMKYIYILTVSSKNVHPTKMLFGDKKI